MDLFGLYAERMVIENELGADISGFHLNALSSGLPLNVNLDTTLNVLAGNCYRLLARNPPATSSPPENASGGTFSTTPGRCAWKKPRARGSRPAHLHAGPHRRWCPRARARGHLVGRATAPHRLPAALNRNPTTGIRPAEDRG